MGRGLKGQNPKYREAGEGAPCLLLGSWFGRLRGRAVNLHFFIRRFFLFVQKDQNCGCRDRSNQQNTRSRDERKPECLLLFVRLNNVHEIST